MRKLFFLLVAVFSLQIAQAQTKIGIKFAPTLSANRIDSGSKTYSVSPNGVGGRFIFGPIADILITDNYYFSTGILFAPKRIGIEVRDPGNNTHEQTYKMQYIQLPATLKLFTNELALDTRVYFQLGTLLDIKVSDKAQEDYTTSPSPGEFIDRTRFFDLGVYLGSGVEYRLGYNTILFGGIFYNRGLINAVTRTLNAGPDINVKNDLIGLELGVKF